MVIKKTGNSLKGPCNFFSKFTFEDPLKISKKSNFKCPWTISKKSTIKGLKILKNTNRPLKNRTKFTLKALELLIKNSLLRSWKTTQNSKYFHDIFRTINVLKSTLKDLCCNCLYKNYLKISFESLWKSSMKSLIKGHRKLS